MMQASRSGLGGIVATAAALLLLLLLGHRVSLADAAQTCSSRENALNAITSDSNCTMELFNPTQNATDVSKVFFVHRNFAEYDANIAVCEVFLGWQSVQSSVVLQFLYDNIRIRSLWEGEIMPPLTAVDGCSSPIKISYNIQEQLEAAEHYPLMESVAVVLGPELSSEVAVASPQLSAYSIPHISYLATSEVFDDVHSYSFLFRTVPSDSFQVQALADILAHFNWSYVAAVSSANLIYGTSGLDGLRRQSYGRMGTASSFCLGVSATMPSDEQDTEQMVRIIERIEADPDIKVIILFVLDEEAQRFLGCLFARNASQYVIVGSEAWTTRVDISKIEPICNCSRTPGDVTKSVPNIIGVAPRTVSDNIFRQLLKTFEDYVLKNGSAVASYAKGNPWLTQYIESTEKCVLLNSGNSNCLHWNTTGLRECPGDAVILPNLTSFDALYPLMFMAHVSNVVSGNISLLSEKFTERVTCHLRNARVACDPAAAEILPASMKSCSGDSCECNAFTKTQSAWPLYNILQLRGKEMIRLGWWQGVTDELDHLTMNTTVDIQWTGYSSAGTPNSTCRDECRPGQRRENGTIYSTACCWSCMQCPVNHVSTGSTFDCTECVFNRNNTYEVSNADNSSCMAAPIRYNDLSDGRVIGELVVCFLFIIFLAVTILIFWRYRDIDLIHCLDIRATTVILMFLTVAQTCTVIILMKPTHTQCVLSKLVSAPWITFCPAVLTVRSLRLSALALEAKEKSVGKFRKLFVSVKGQALGIICVFLVSELIALTAYFAGGVKLLTEPLGIDRVLKHCTITLLPSAILYYTWLIVMLFAALFVSFRVRQSRDLVKDNEGTQLFVCAVCLCFVCIALEPSFYLATSDVKPQIHFATITSEGIVVWVVLYASRLFLLFKHRHEL